MRDFLRECAHSCFAVIDRGELVQVQQIGQLLSIDAVALVPGLECSAFLRGSHTTTSVTCGLQQDRATRPRRFPSSKVTCKLPPSPWTNWRTVSAFVSSTAFHRQLAGRIQNRPPEIVAW